MKPLLRLFSMCLALLLVATLAPMSAAKEAPEDWTWEAPAPETKQPPALDPVAMADEVAPLPEETVLPKLPSAPAPQAATATPPDNDHFSRARIVPNTGLSIAQSTRGATVEAGEPLPCYMGATVWFQITMSTSGTLTVFTDVSNYDTVVAAYSQASGTRGALLACNDDTGGTLQSRIVFPVTAGRTYYVQAGGYYGSTGDLAIHFNFAPCTQNDLRACATQVPTVPFRATQSTKGYTMQSGEPSPCGGMAATAWYRFDSTQAQYLVVDTGGSSFDTVLAIYVDNGGSLGAMVACNDDRIFGLGSTIRFTTSPGTSYFIQVGGYYGATGALSLTVATCNTNDYAGCARTVPAVPFSAAQSTGGFTLEAGEQRPCGAIGATAWYAFTPASTRIVVVDTAGSSFDTVLAVYAGSVTSSPVTCLDDTSTSLQSRVSFTAYAGVTYYIQAGGYNSASGLLQLAMS